MKAGQIVKLLKVSALVMISYVVFNVAHRIFEGTLRIDPVVAGLTYVSLWPFVLVGTGLMSTLSYYYSKELDEEKTKT